MTSPMRTLTLREWEPRSGLALDAAERDALRAVFAAQVQPAPGSESTFNVRPQGRIGALQIGGTAVVVEPKIAISNVVFLLGYSADPGRWREDDARIGHATDLTGGVVELFLLMVERALSQGLLRGYRSEDADLHTVQGRIDFGRQLRSRPGQYLPLAVRRSRYDVDVTENQIVLGAAMALDRLNVRSPHLRHRLRRVIETMADVSRLHFPAGQVPDVTWTRLNRHYEPAVRLARLLLSGSCPDLRIGTVQARGLVLDMAVVFEDFLRVALREALHATPREFPTGDHCPHLFLDQGLRVRLKPDLSLWSHGQCTFVGDAKYKRDPGPGRSADIYQLLAYATATGLPSATLVYAQGPSEPRWHDIPAAGVRIGVRHLDLAVPPTVILRHVQSLAAEIVGQTVRQGAA